MQKAAFVKSIKDIVETIFHIEEDMDLFNQKIDGVYFWELIRFNVVENIAQELEVLGQAHTNLELDLEVVVQYVTNAVKNFFCKNPFLASKSDMLFFGHPRRKLMEDGLWWDIYHDHVINSLHNKQECLLLEPPYLNAHYEPSKTPNIRYLDLFLFFSNIYKFICSFKYSIKDNDKIFVEEIESRINKHFNIEIELKSYVKNMLLIRKSRLPIYSYLLNKVNPKVVILTVSYGRGVNALVEACKNKNIPVVELQHGAISKYHTGYSFPDIKNLKRFPDYFLTFGDYWKDITNLPLPKSKIYSVGYPFFELETAKYKNISVKDQVVFISQGTIGRQLSRFAVELKYRNDLNMDIVYKLHPGEYHRWKKDYPWLINSGVKVFDDDSEPIYKLLAQSKILVGVYSTLVYEGLGMGLKTYLIDLPGVENMDELINCSVVTKITNVDELIQKLKNPSGDRIISDYFFKSDALINIEESLFEIIHKS